MVEYDLVYTVVPPPAVITTFTVKVGPALDDLTRPVNTANLLAYRTSLPSAGTFRYEGPKITSIEGRPIPTVVTICYRRWR